MRLQVSEAVARKSSGRATWCARFECERRAEGHPVVVDLRTHNLDDAIFEEAIRRSMNCPQCGRTMRLVGSWFEQPPVSRV